jgi:hypothetical protein
VCGSVATAPLVFVHQVTVANSFGAYSIIDHGAINNNGSVKLFVTLDNSNGLGGSQVVAVRRITSDQWPLAVDRWVLENMNGAQVDPLPVNARYNILVLP